jgi:hypothetical protein
MAKPHRPGQLSATAPPRGLICLGALSKRHCTGQRSHLFESPLICLNDILMCLDKTWYAAGRATDRKTTKNLRFALRVSCKGRNPVQGRWLFM